VRHALRALATTAILLAPANTSPRASMKLRDVLVVQHRQWMEGVLVSEILHEPCFHRHRCKNREIPAIDLNA